MAQHEKALVCIFHEKRVHKRLLAIYHDREFRAQELTETAAVTLFFMDGHWRVVSASIYFVRNLEDFQRTEIYAD